MTQKNIIIAVLILVFIGVTVLVLNYQRTVPVVGGDKSEEATTSLKEDNATTTDTEVSDSGEAANVSGGSTINKKGPSPLRVSIEYPELEPIELGPRLKAAFPGDALRYFAEAMRGGDRERALSYIHPNVREQYKKALEAQYADRQHPVVIAYYTGTVGDAELTQPQNGIYEITVQPKDTELPFRAYAIYESEAGEFVLLEL
ncbi:hypothetical protein CL652_01520 [bacterium]|nr:hypothetical protein [bacterium]|tara:strand:- start:3694 stop:4299 length:606 start_codon:yes stop_codon:yes gene_type:complete